MRQATRTGELAGCAGVVLHRGSAVFRRAFGYADLEHKVPFKHDTICRIYCMTKAYVNFVAMILAEEGLLDLDAPAARYVPSLQRMKVLTADGQAPAPAKKVMTVRHLLTHMAGFSYGADFGYPSNELQKRYAGIVEGVESGRLSSLAAFVDELAAVPLVLEPGTRYEYGYSTDVLGRVMEVASGQSLDALLRDRLFQPLGMHDTAFGVPAEKLPRLGAVYGNAATWGHLYGKAPGAVPAASKPGLVRLDGGAAEESAWAAQRVKVFSGGGLLGHNRGGLVSTTDDTVAFVRMLLAQGKAPNGKQLLRRSTIAAMERNVLVGPWRDPERRDVRWCLVGDMIKDKRSLYFQQGGAGGNYWQIDRKRDLAVVLFMQQVDGEDWKNPEHSDVDKVFRKIVDDTDCRRAAPTGKRAAKFGARGLQVRKTATKRAPPRGQTVAFAAR